jgi:hypothetical protein
MPVTATAPASATRLWLARVFLWLLAVQAFHFVEHSVQLVQVFVLNDPNGSGLLGNLVNFELLHLGYNTLYLDCSGCTRK